MNRLALPASVAASVLALSVAACSTGSPAAPPTPDAAADVATSVDDSGSSTDSATEGDSGSPVDGGAPVAVTFSYTPLWQGVKTVEVVGGFGQSTDWSKTASFLTLTQTGSTYSGTAMLPPAQYLYLFRVTGDDSAVPAATYQRYAVDPLDTAFAACPTTSPTYSKIDANPCSQVTVTAAGGPAPATPVHVTGSVAVGGSAAKDLMVVLEREEPKSHHYFANRVTVGADGAFDLVASAGNYRLQVQYPTLLSVSDLDRMPSTANALRRAISASFLLGTAAMTVPTPDLAFTSYGLFAPSGDAGSLPTSFTFETGEARLDVYGGPGDGGIIDIGDPWFTSDPTTDGGAAFGGTFNTAQATQDAAVPALRYMWGTEQAFGADASVAWTNQSMVLPITWQ
jgi:hypothetical protein